MEKNKDMFYLKMWDYLSCYFILFHAKQIKLYIKTFVSKSISKQQKTTIKYKNITMGSLHLCVCVYISFFKQHSQA